MLLRAFLIIALLAISLTGSATEDPAVIIVFGDSITAGYNAGENDLNGNANNTKGIGSGQTNFGLPDQLLNLFLDESRRDAVVVNWGYGGTSSSFGERRISGNTAQTASEHAGSQYIILIMYGTNDFGQGIMPSTTRFNTAQMIIRARINGYNAVVGNLTPRDDEDVRPYNSQIELAAITANPPATLVNHYSHYSTFPENGLSLLSTEFSNFKQRNIRLHPSNEGYTVIAQYWFDTVLAGLIEQRALVLSPLMLLLLDD
jgi:lysophospholipase L1-like esterase